MNKDMKKKAKLVNCIFFHIDVANYVYLLV